MKDSMEWRRKNLHKHLFLEAMVAVSYGEAEWMKVGCFWKQLAFQVKNYKWKYSSKVERMVHMKMAPKRKIWDSDMFQIIIIQRPCLFHFSRCTNHPEMNKETSSKPNLNVNMGSSRRFSGVWASYEKGNMSFFWQGFPPYSPYISCLWCHVPSGHGTFATFAHVTHVRCYTTDRVGWGGGVEMRTFLALAHR